MATFVRDLKEYFGEGCGVMVFGRGGSGHLIVTKLDQINWPGQEVIYVRKLTKRGKIYFLLGNIHDLYGSDNFIEIHSSSQVTNYST